MLTTYNKRCRYCTIIVPGTKEYTNVRSLFCVFSEKSMCRWVRKECVSDGETFEYDYQGWHDHGLLPVGLGDVSLHGV